MLASDGYRRCACATASGRTVNSPRLLKAALGRRGNNIEGQLTGAVVDSQSRPQAGTDVRLVWSRSVGDLDRAAIDGVKEFDLKHCPNCGGEQTVIAAVLKQPVIEKILTHLALQTRAPPWVPARGQELEAACAQPAYRRPSGPAS